MTIPLYTPVANEKLPIDLMIGDGVVSIGSCFADEIAQRLTDGGFAVNQNPFGTLYNPSSIASALERTMENREIGFNDLVEHEGLWHSWHHHGKFSQRTAEETLAVCNGSIHKAHAALREAKLLIITFGTAWIYLRTRHANIEGLEELEVVANCHKLPPQTFIRRRMSVEEIVALWTPLLQKLKTEYPTLLTLFTVSPIRHMSDGAHGNQLSKSTLLLAVDELISRNTPRCCYFPAYEIMMDELRDYRFYAADMTHPTNVAADIVYDRFQQSTMSAATIQQAHNNAKELRRQSHIPLH